MVQSTKSEFSKKFNTKRFQNCSLTKKNTLRTCESDTFSPSEIVTFCPKEALDFRFVDGPNIHGPTVHNIHNIRCHEKFGGKGYCYML